MRWFRSPRSAASASPARTNLSSLKDLPLLTTANQPLANPIGFAMVSTDSKDLCHGGSPAYWPACCATFFPAFGEDMEREYVAFRHANLATPTLTFATCLTLAYIPWWYISVMPEYRLPSYSSWYKVALIMDCLRWVVIATAWAQGIFFLRVHSLALRQYSDLMLLLFGIGWAIFASLSPDRLLALLGTSYAGAVQQEYEYREQGLITDEEATSFSGGRVCNAWVDASVDPDAHPACVYRNYETLQVLVMVIYVAYAAFGCSLHLPHLAALLGATALIYTVFRGVWGDLDSMASQYMIDASSVYVLFILFFSAAHKVDVRVRAEFIERREAAQRAAQMEKELQAREDRIADMERMTLAFEALGSAEFGSAEFGSAGSRASRYPAPAEWPSRCSSPVQQTTSSSVTHASGTSLASASVARDSMSVTHDSAERQRAFSSHKSMSTATSLLDALSISHHAASDKFSFRMAAPETLPLPEPPLETFLSPVRETSETPTRGAAEVNDVLDVSEEVKLPSSSGELPKAPGDQLRNRLGGVSILPAERKRRLEQVARSLRVAEYSLQTFHDEMVACFPELRLYLAEAGTTSGNSGTDEYSRTIGALFAFYWLMRLRLTQVPNSEQVGARVLFGSQRTSVRGR